MKSSCWRGPTKCGPEHRCWEAPSGQTPASDPASDANLQTRWSQARIWQLWLGPGGWNRAKSVSWKWGQTDKIEDVFFNSAIWGPFSTLSWMMSNVVQNIVVCWERNWTGSQKPWVFTLALQFDIEEVSLYLWISGSSSLFFEDFIYFSTEGKGGRKRGREISTCGCLLHAPHWGPGLQSRHAPWWGIEPATLWFAGQHSIHWAAPARASSPLNE